MASSCESLFSFLFYLPVLWTLFSFSAASLWFSTTCSLPLCPHLCGVVYALLILFCHYKCCSLYPHPYDEPNTYPGCRWMVWVKKKQRKTSVSWQEPFSPWHICPSALTWGDMTLNVTYSHIRTHTHTDCDYPAVMMIMVVYGRQLTLLSVTMAARCVCFCACTFSSVCGHGCVCTMVLVLTLELGEAG